MGIRALRRVNRSKPESYMDKGIPDRFPFRQGLAHFKGRVLLSILPLTLLLSYLKLVETSYLKLNTLLKYTLVDKYG